MRAAVTISATDFFSLPGTRGGMAELAARSQGRYHLRGAGVVVLAKGRNDLWPGWTLGPPYPWSTARWLDLDLSGYVCTLIDLEERRVLKPVLHPDGEVTIFELPSINYDYLFLAFGR
jgi:hypothetical protein